MLARNALVAQLLELGALAGLALVLARAGHGFVAILATCIAIAIGWRVLFVAAQFALAWCYHGDRAPEHRIGLAATLAMVAREGGAFLAASLAEVPWERRMLRPDPAPTPGMGVPIVLVHGYFANRGYFRRLVRWLESAGHAAVFAPNLRSWLAPIERMVDGLEAEIRRVHEGCGARVVLVGHSMGGLAIRAYLARHGGERVAAVVTIGSPHAGSRIAHWGVGRNARQMEPGSGFLATLAEAESAREPRVPLVSIYSPHDNMVAPAQGSVLPWARNVALPGRGHIALLDDPETRRIIDAVLREAR